ncbi:rRNA large subunit m3Psi methyltransferase RlmH [Secundilactobacillus collinoides DSM 20515 = JCM 1123]|uniref:Ribosomal RNA large subunit methyltransferase H n=2 Tax=Secundilactobacillus collinoides TaxID=33960 RepID=A0A0R2BDK8_SECCO|nr:rRNA large subunit m3Psi methyltransferase RlmH [Secundilactobacillus collinoides DSM 20515 = JCM 1123]
MKTLLSRGLLGKIETENRVKPKIGIPKLVLNRSKKRKSYHVNKPVDNFVDKSDEKGKFMNIKLVVVGKLKEKYFKQGIQEYAKRLSRFCKFQIVEVPDEKAPESLSDAQMAQVMEKEGDRILDKIKDREYVFALAILGKERTSEAFAKEIKDLTTYGHSDITFVIGGSLGLDPAVLKRADTQISFGKFTLPHQLMRLVLTEQIYRAFMINEGSPYHK